MSKPQGESQVEVGQEPGLLTPTRGSARDIGARSTWAASVAGTLPVLVGQMLCFKGSGKRVPPLMDKLLEFDINQSTLTWMDVKNAFFEAS